MEGIAKQKENKYVIYVKNYTSVEYLQTIEAKKA